MLPITVSNKVTATEVSIRAICYSGIFTPSESTENWTQLTTRPMHLWMDKKFLLHVWLWRFHWNRGGAELKCPLNELMTSRLWQKVITSSLAWTFNITNTHLNSLKCTWPWKSPIDNKFITTQCCYVAVMIYWVLDYTTVNTPPTPTQCIFVTRGNTAP